MKRHFFKLAIVAIILLNAALSWAAQHDAIVKILCKQGSSSLIGSGVCVREDGVILTVRHVVADGVCKVQFRDATYPVVFSMIPPKEGVAVLKIDAGKPLPTLSIATSRPKVGETVWIMGYPRGNWGTRQTVVTSHALYFSDDPSARLTGVFAPTIPGTSGGPLITADWKVAGISSVSAKRSPDRNRGRSLGQMMRVSSDSSFDNTGGMYLSLRHVKDAYERFTAQYRGPPQGKRVLYAYIGKRCLPCDRFQQDVQDGRFSQFEVRYIFDPVRWKQTTGQTPTLAPAFYVQGQGGRSQILGYTDAPGLIQSVLKIVVRIGKMLYNVRHRDSEIGSIPPPNLSNGDEMGPPPIEEATTPKQFKREEQADPPPVEPVVEWSHVKVVIVAAKFLAGIKGIVAGKAVEFGEGPIRRKLPEAADLQFVLERNRPARFEAVTEAFGSVPERVAIIVLVARQDLGIVKGIIAKKVLSSLPDKLKNYPIEFVSVRAHGETFLAIESALKTEEPTPQPSAPKKPSQSVVMALFSDPKTYLLGLLAERVQDRAAAWWRRRKNRTVVTEDSK